MTEDRTLAQWPRKSDRVTVEATVIVRRLREHNFRVRVYDISCHGCRVDFLTKPRLEDRAWVKFDGLQGLEGIVCWVDGFTAGLEFVTPMHPAVFDRIASQLV